MDHIICLHSFFITWIAKFMLSDDVLFSSTDNAIRSILEAITDEHALLWKLSFWDYFACVLYHDLCDPFETNELLYYGQLISFLYRSIFKNRLLKLLNGFIECFMSTHSVNCNC